MILKSLELIGFKSFGEATRLDFTQGFTAIVGPNGCGKSNVSDAIRWVIGEQNSRTLRGGKLTDLIFNGSQSRKPLNRAEITLVIGDLPQGLRVANVPNVGEEIKITRCYYRSGQSEYYINQVPCRLKDIVDLFLDLGISSKSITIIEQNHIHEIITAKPEDRRNLIEEAAGILKFKHRRHEAQLKLESAEQNLMRITDIVQEFKRQAESLKRQASKADRYKRYQAEIKDLQLNLWAKNLRLLKKKLKNTEEEFDQLTEQKIKISAKNSALEVGIEQLKLEIEEAQMALNQRRIRMQELAGEINKSENAIELCQSHIETVQEDTAAADNEITDMHNEIEILSQKIQIQREELGQVSEDIDQHEVTKRQQFETLTISKTRLRGKEDTAHSLEKALKLLYHQTAQKKNEITALETRKQFLQNRAEKLLNERSEMVGIIDTEQKRAGEMETQSRIKIETFETIKAENEDVLEKFSRYKVELKEQDQCVNAANEIYLAHRSLLASMRDLRNKFEGFQDGVKALMTNNNGGNFPGLRAVLVEVIQTSIQYEPALEAVLGNRLQSVIVNSYSDTVKAIHYLKSHQSGRGSFIPIQPKIFQGPPINFNGNSAILGKMIDKVQCPEEYRPLLDHLIGNVVLVQDLETALDLHKKAEFQGVIVTQSGEVIDSTGIVSGGQVSDTSSGLLSQKREIEELEGKVNSLRQELDAATRKRDQFSKNLNHMETRLSALQPALREAEMVQADQRRDWEEVQREIERFEQKLSSLDYERSSGQLEFQELSEEGNHLTGDLDSLEFEKRSQEASQIALRQELEILKNELELQTQNIHDLDVLIASIKGKREILLSEIKQLHLQQTNLNQRIEKRLQDQQINAEKIVKHESAIQSTEQAVLDSVSEKNRIAEETVSFEERLTEKEDTLKGVEQESRTVFKDYQVTAELLSQVEVKRSETKIQSAHLQEQAYKDYGLTPGELLGQFNGDVNEIEVSETVLTLKEKVARMGDVNLAALSEYQQTLERYTFLNRQQEDLAESIKTLKQAIKKINQTIQERFLTTFHLVNEQFQSMYERLFQGGQASLVMLDEANPIESGVDIHAQPLGKKMQKLSLLSGGEKAMTAISLIFSLLKVRPSPFCLLDEVDAPLDDPNVVRFQTILQEMADNTQFILITHNQKTMSFADALYGVTMEERGVSKAVSVHLN